MAGKKEVETKDAKKAQALNDAIKQIEKQFGKGSVMKLGDRAAVDVAVIPTSMRMFRKGTETFEIEPGGDLSFLL